SALDLHAQRRSAGVDARFGYPQAQPGNAEALHQAGREALGEGFHQLEASCLCELLDHLASLGVIQRLVQLVILRGRTNVPAQGQIESQTLTNTALPV